MIEELDATNATKSHNLGGRFVVFFKGSKSQLCKS